MVERVVVTQDRNANLELRTPFSYLNGITDEVRKHSEISSSNGESKTTNLEVGRSESECSTQIPSCRAGGTRTHNPEGGRF